MAKNNLSANGVSRGHFLLKTPSLFWGKHSVRAPREGSPHPGRRLRGGVSRPRGAKAGQGGLFPQPQATLLQAPRGNSAHARRAPSGSDPLREAVVAPDARLLSDSAENPQEHQRFPSHWVWAASAEHSAHAQRRAFLLQVLPRRPPPVATPSRSSRSLTGGLQRRGRGPREGAGGARRVGVANGGANQDGGGCGGRRSRRRRPGQPLHGPPRGCCPLAAALGALLAGGGLRRRGRPAGAAQGGAGGRQSR